jgi:hypothetical protein
MDAIKAEVLTNNDPEDLYLILHRRENLKSLGIVVQSVLVTCLVQLTQNL